MFVKHFISVAEGFYMMETVDMRSEIRIKFLL